VIAATSVQELPLRSRKAAQTRLGLVDALVEALRDRPFDQITVRSLCSVVGISEPTFFKHFPCKEDLLVLFVQLWSIGLAIKIDDESLSGRETVALVFDETARQMRTAPRVMHEIIAHQMRSEGPPQVAPPTFAELVTHFGDEPAAWHMAPVPVQGLIAKGLERARDRQELPAETALEDATWALVSIFFGVPASTRSPRNVARRYRQAVDLVWAGLGRKTGSQ